MKLNTSRFEFIQSLPAKIGGNSVKRSDVSGWLNHFETHFVAYHYCGALFREDLHRLMDGGFSPEFYRLIGGDDDEFVKRLIFKGFTFKIPAFSPEKPFTVHQYHPKTENLQSWGRSESEKTRIELTRALVKMGFAPEIDIALAPIEETPQARRKLL